MEGDEPQTVPIPVLWRISIHSLRMEGDAVCRRSFR